MELKASHHHLRVYTAEIMNPFNGIESVAGLLGAPVVHGG